MNQELRKLHKVRGKGDRIKGAIYNSIPSASVREKRSKLSSIRTRSTKKIVERLPRFVITPLAMTRRVLFWNNLHGNYRLFFNVILGVIFLITLPIILFNLFHPGSAKAAWLDDNWGYRKSIAITAHTSAETNVYINISHANGVDIDTSDTAKFQTDCGDIRFTTATGDLLKYYIVAGGNACGSAQTNIHVFFKSFPAGAQTIYMYYGNASAVNGFSLSDFSPEAASYTFGTLGSEEKAVAPVAYFKFDEGTGTTTTDSSSNKLVGTLTNMSSTAATNSGWMTEDNCISNKCLGFDGINDYVNVSGSNSSKYDLTGDFTISLWAKANTWIGTNPMLISKRDTFAGMDWQLFYNTSTSRINFWFGNSGSEQLFSSLIVNPSTNTWHHYVVTRSGSTFSLYLDGVLKGTASDATLMPTGDTIRIGASNSTPGNFFNGALDNVKIYQYARSAAQVGLDYNARNAAKGAGATLGVNASNLNGALANGLVGYWKMDEATWSGTINEVLDSSGNGNNGQAQGSTNSKAYPLTGKFGNGGQFTNGGNQYVSVTNAASLQPSSAITIAGWINPATLGEGNLGHIIYKAGGGGNYRVYISTFGGGYTINCDLDTGANTIANVQLSFNTWSFFACVYDGKKTNLYQNGVLIKSTTGTFDGPSTTGNVYIGNNDTQTRDFDGIIDDLRIYNRGLSSQEVSQLYNWAPGPLGYWNFEEGQGSTANDTSGNGNTGTFVNSPQWAQGKTGKGVKFNGSNTYVAITDTASLEYTGGNFTYEGWFYVDPNSSATNDPYMFSKPWNGSGEYNYQIQLINGSSPRCNLAGNAAKVTTSVFTGSGWHHIACTTDSSGNLIEYVDGVARTSTNWLSTITSWTPNSGNQNRQLVIGTSFPQGQGWGGSATATMLGKADEVRVYNYVRSPAQIIQDMNYSHPVGNGSPVGFWRFNEGYGTTARDSSGKGNDGTLTNMASPATTGSGWTNNGKSSRALVFDGSNDYVSMGNPSSLQQTGDITLSAWVNPSSVTTNEDIIAKRGAAGQWGYRLWIDSTGKPKIDVSSDGVANIATASATTALSKFNWYHLVGVFSAGNSLTLYVNGVQKAQTTTSIPTSIKNSTANALVGSENAGATNNFNGVIDEVKVYSGAISADDVKIDYNRGVSVVAGVLGTDASGNASNSAERMYCPPGDTSASCGPVANWEFDEGQGSTVNDNTGNNNTGTWSGNGTQHWVIGKYNKAGNFVQSLSDVVAVNNSTTVNPTSAITLQAWVYHTSTSNSQYYFSKDNGGIAYDFWEQNGLVKFKINDASANTITVTSNSTLQQNRWYFLTATFIPSTSVNIYINGVLDNTASTTIASLNSDTSVLRLGRQVNPPGNSMNGKLDQMRIYNYARNGSQVAWDYNRGAPLAWYKFDECQGTSISDLTGNGYSGILTLGSATAGTCADGTGTTLWNKGATGKINSSMYFDGTNDYITVGSGPQLDFSTGSFSYGGWAKFSDESTQNFASIINKLDTGNGTSTAGYQLNVNTSNRPYCELNNGTTNNTRTATKAYNDNNWHFYMCVVDRTTNKLFLYIDGVKVSNGFNAIGSSDSFTSTTQAVRIGDRPRVDIPQNNRFKGQIDDVRIYNYPLTVQQMQLLYNNGSAVYFGPATGAP